MRGHWQSLMGVLTDQHLGAQEDFFRLREEGVGGREVMHR